MDLTPAAHAAALWAGLHLVLLLVLSVLVTRQRRKHGVALGDGGVPELERAIRAFGNATEYVPTALIGLAILALAGAPPLLVHLIGFVLFAGRGLHAVGLSRSGEATLPRAAGVLATWIAYIAAAAALLFYAVP
ncbi:glutathione S-transferase [Phenylobacterium zucineum HLK1]|uniref:Glutathione S-transferase n=1 Tax=Phenylobacterium zucineum (strain HLK1) TaxID=450851 RepID=B4REJ2_PHEZH|nr:MAPEG family protein [Phenylobacterium zucineum]ACG76934.1 glutathione S-transferase [Phenylobacterium zucineum HLK1]